MKFFPPQDDVLFHLLCACDVPDLDIISGPGITATAFPGDSKSAVVKIQGYLTSHGITRICFASLATYHIWQEVRSLSGLTLFYAGEKSLADISLMEEHSNEIEIRQLLALLKMRPALLQSEAASNPTIKECLIYQDHHSFLTATTPALLLTKNSDLCQALYSLNSSECSIFHIESDMYHTNLGIKAKQPDFLLTLNRLLFAAQPKVNCRMDTLAEALAPGLGRDLRSYSFFAEYYDNYMAHVNYEEWVDLMLKWYKRFSPAPLQRILELACGTANASEILVFRGFDVDACDNSPFMLNKADAKPFKPNLYLASMVDPIPGKGYDLIFCLFDSINYLSQKTEIKTLLDHVHSSLRPGGVFIFDISTVMNSLQNFNETIAHSKVKDGYIVHASDYDPLSAKQISLLTLYRSNGQGYNRFEERHIQRVYRTRELIEIIATTRMKLKAIFTPGLSSNLLSKRNQDIDSQYPRLFYLLQKIDESPLS